MGRKECVGHERFLGEKGTLLKAIGASGFTRHISNPDSDSRPFPQSAFNKKEATNE